MFEVLYLLACSTVVNGGSHSLMLFGTYIVGQTPFPEFSAVLMLDDLQIGYYDTNTWKSVYRTQSDLKYHDEEQTDAHIAFSDMYNDLKSRALYIKENLNHTDGVHVHQRIAGCELLNDNKPGLFHFWDALNGQSVEELTFNIEKGQINIEKLFMANSWNQQLLEQILKNIYHPICIKTLKRYLHIEKNNVMRKVKPRVRLLKKKLSDSEGLQIICLATGFYPRHINLTLFRDAQPVDDDQMTGGEILPNGDRTYQMRKSLRISEEELREGHQYNCTMKLLNLDNKLDIMFDAAEYDPGSYIVCVVSFVVIMCVLVTPALVIWRMKRRAAGSDSKTSLQMNSLPTSSE